MPHVPELHCARPHLRALRIDDPRQPGGLLVLRDPRRAGPIEIIQAHVNLDSLIITIGDADDAQAADAPAGIDAQRMDLEDLDVRLSHRWRRAARHGARGRRIAHLIVRWIRTHFWQGSVEIRRRCRGVVGSHARVSLERTQKRQ